MSGAPLDRGLLDFAVELADRAGRLAAERFFAGDFEVGIKPDGTEVTDADLAVEELIRTELGRRCPDDAVYGEEAGAAPGVSGRRWIIDPINGTRHFVHRVPLFGVSIAYEDEHGSALGVINQPVARQIVYAGRGLGCRVRTGDAEAAPALRETAELRRARVEMVNPGRWPGDLLLALHQNVIVTGLAGGVVGVLTGLADAVVMAGSEMGYEDLAPLPVLLEEAGGRATDLSGGPLPSGPGTALVSTGRFHDALLGLLRPPGRP
ncbi:inositol monophosphatase family protein [Actinoallomurus acaciae]|uniref:Inositol monophosphatase family protein n=1 Tax=Actinoallomurus acaciae TaxID=502577 RepID=A0ABV5YHF6_9ACTN